MKSSIYFSFVLLCSLNVCHGIPPPEGHPGVDDHHAHPPPELTPEDIEKLQAMGVRFNELMIKMCSEETMAEDKLKAIEACHTSHRREAHKGDPAVLQACEDQVMGNKTLDEKRKDMCNSSPKERRARGHAVSYPSND